MYVTVEHRDNGRLYEDRRRDGARLWVTIFLMFLDF
jgi:hypothetical protein